MTSVNKIIIYLLIVASVIITVSGLLSLTMSVISAVRIVISISFTLFFPGFALSYVFFPGRSKDSESSQRSLSPLERILLSIAISIAVVPLTLFLVNQIGLAINLITSIVTVIGIIVLALIIILARKQK